MVPLLLPLLPLPLVPPTVGEVGWGGQVEVFQVGFKRDRERVWRQKRRKRRREPTANKKRSRQSVERRTSLTSNVEKVEIKTTQRNCLFMIRSRSDRLFESL